MKINIQTLMNIISEEEKNLNNIIYSVKNHVINTTIIELDGTENITEDFKEEFTRELNQIEELTLKISKLKATLFEKNNAFKLKDGRSIQQAISDNTYLRKLKQTYETLLTYKTKKTRISEYNDAYFECKTANFDKKSIEDKIIKIDKKLQETDFEISKLNSIEFDISI